MDRSFTGEYFFVGLLIRVEIHLRASTEDAIMKDVIDGDLFREKLI